MRITGLDHVQLAMPEGREDDARGFYTELLGITERPKPPHLAQRGGSSERLPGSGSARDFQFGSPTRRTVRQHPAVPTDSGPAGGTGRRSDVSVRDARLGAFSVLFVGGCVAVFVLLDSPGWMLAVAAPCLVYAVARLVWFLARPPWQLRWANDADSIEVRSLTRLVRRTRVVSVDDLKVVRPVMPYGTHQWDGAALASRVGRLIGLCEIALRTSDCVHRIIGYEDDLAGASCPAPARTCRLGA